MSYDNDFDTLYYPRPHDLPATDATIPSTASILSSTALLPRNLVSGIFVASTISSAPSSSTDTFLVCAGRGFDSAATGIIATAIIPSAIGLLLWLVFGILRPHFRQIFALREWFVPPNLRPKPLRSSLFAFLFPNVPLVPPLPSDVSDAGRSNAQDAKLFPSDEELSQRVLFVALKIAFGWSVIALCGVLPLYLVKIPCNTDLPAPAVSGQGGYSTLSDISLIRLLRTFDNGNAASKDLIGRVSLPDGDGPFHVRVRVIVLTVLTIILGLLPALLGVLREFNTIVAYRRRWLQFRCQRKDLGWLSARKAPEFATWGERQFKDYLVKIGLSSTLNDVVKQKRNADRSRARNEEKRTRRREAEQPLNLNDNIDVDVQTLFSIGDTHRLALLIDERDEILENLEIAETKYIRSFRVTTPDPSVLDFVPSPPAFSSRPHISRPLPLGPSQRRTRGRRHMNRAFAASSLGPTSFVAPSSYYKLRGVQSINGGRFSGVAIDRHQSLTESINSRVIGSRFQEVNRNSAYGRLPLGSHVTVEKSGELGPGVLKGDWLPPIPDPRLFGPNYGLVVYDEVDENGTVSIPEEIDAEWVDLSAGPPDDDDTRFNGLPSNQAGPSFIRQPRVPKPDPPPMKRRETFPLRDDNYQDPEALPPHLRLQPTQPFVRPLDGLGFDDLGHVYADITQWRSRLKIINAEIAEAQQDSYEDIASGTNIAGWLLVGRGLRFIPGVELIEGRAKEDIRWDVLQNERSLLDSIVMWVVIVTVIIAMAAALTAAVGLALAVAPDFSHFLTFLQPLLLKANIIVAGIATVFVPAVAATVFISLGLATINWVAKIHGSVSISANQILVFKVTFYVLTAVTLWIIAIGALLFSLQGIDTNTGVTRSLANGAIYMGTFMLALILNVAIIIPAWLVLQPFQFWAVVRAEKHAITPRQNFRAIYPRTYDPSFAIGSGVLAILFASTFAFIFPLIAPAVVILLSVTLIAHRFLVGYVYARTHSQTGGLLQIWLLRRFGTVLSFQPILLGLIFLTRQFWIEGGVLVGTGLFIIVFVEWYASWKTRLPGRKSLSPITRNSLETFGKAARRYVFLENDTGTINDSSVPGTRTRGSMASVLEMMSATLAVTPSSFNFKGVVPLQTETLDDLTATERAARTHPDAPPHLPPLGFTDHAKDMAGILYAPELIAPAPIIWLPNDSAGVSRSEANDLERYHSLAVTLDARTQDEVSLHRRSFSS